MPTPTVSLSDWKRTIKRRKDCELERESKGRFDELERISKRHVEEAECEGYDMRDDLRTVSLPKDAPVNRETCMKLLEACEDCWWPFADFID